MVRKEGLSLQRMLTHEALAAVAQDLRYSDVSSLYAAVGEGTVTAQSVVRRLIQAIGGAEEEAEDVSEGVALPSETSRRERLPRGDSGVVVRGTSDVWIKLAKCCTPVPGDAIVGFVTRGAGVSVHRQDCANIDHLRAQPERVLEVEWSPTAQSLFLVQIQVEALDRARLLSDITRVLSDQHVNILSASVTTTRDRVAKSRFTFEMGDPKHLGHVLRAVRGVDGVFDAYRVTS